MPRNERLIQHRIARNWRQQEVADHVGVALVTFQRWERGSQQPSAYWRIKLCALFGKSAQELGLLEASSRSATPEREATDAVQRDATLPVEQAQGHSCLIYPPERSPSSSSISKAVLSIGNITPRLCVQPLPVTMPFCARSLPHMAASSSR